MISASALKAHCAYPNVLSKLHPPSANSQAAMDKGTLFHSAVELWAKGGALPDVHDDEVRGWLELLAMTWGPNDGMRFEWALGLGVGGAWVDVIELEPHVYGVRGSEFPAELLTAGRADLVLLIEREDGRRIAHVRDWKTGKYAVTPAPQNLQLTALALAAADALQADGFVREIYYARDGYLDADPGPIMLDSPEAAEAWEMVERAAKLDETPRPGEWCEPCWERRMKRCNFAQAVAA